MIRKPFRRAPVLLALAALAWLSSTGCRSSAPAPARSYRELDALGWFQTSVENRQLQRSVYAAATRALAAALADPSWRALDQPAEVVELPPAVIVDIDETVLDNSPYQVEMLRRGEIFSAQAWTQWVDRAEAEAIPGAVEFAVFAAERGVTIFYVSNRDAEHEEATRRNLVRAGFPVPEEPDVVLLRGERPEWASDKAGRRSLVAEGYRVLLLIGDDLNDFLSGAREASLGERAELAAAHEAKFGSEWFVLPNPLYGSWKRAFGAGLPAPEDGIEPWLERLRGYE